MLIWFWSYQDNEVPPYFGGFARADEFDATGVLHLPLEQVASTLGQLSEQSCYKQTCLQWCVPFQGNYLNKVHLLTLPRVLLTNAVSLPIRQTLHRCTTHARKQEYMTYVQPRFITPLFYIRRAISTFYLLPNKGYIQHFFVLSLGCLKSLVAK